MKERLNKPKTMTQELVKESREDKSARIIFATRRLADLIIALLPDDTNSEEIRYLEGDVPKGLTKDEQEKVLWLARTIENRRLLIKKERERKLRIPTLDPRF